MIQVKHSQDQDWEEKCNNLHLQIANFTAKYHECKVLKILFFPLSNQNDDVRRRPAGELRSSSVATLSYCPPEAQRLFTGDPSPGQTIALVQEESPPAGRELPSTTRIFLIPSTPLGRSCCRAEPPWIPNAKTFLFTLLFFKKTKQYFLCI